MGGRTIRAFPRRRFNFTTSQLPASQVIEVVMAERLDVSGYKTVELLGRLHNGGPLPQAGQKLEILAVADGFTDEDPGQTFRRPSSAAAATVTFDNTITAPFYLPVTLSTPFGPLITIIVKLTQPATPGLFDETISCDVHMRDC
jgi:hypothetical protein